MTDLVLVNPNARISAPFAAIEPPLWLGMIAGYRMCQGQNVVVVDAEAENLTVEQTVARVNELNPKETIIVCMGNNPSVSSTPKWPVTEELLKYIDAKVTGIHPIAVNHPKAIKGPFEGTPVIPWFLFPLPLYRAHNWHALGYDSPSPYGVLYTSLNCPYSCYYCNIHTLYGDRRMRLRDMRHIKEDLRAFANGGVQHIKIWDELFCLNKRRVTEICDFIYKERFKFNIWAYARVDSVTPLMLWEMKSAGINWLAYGFESVIDPKFVERTEEVIKMTRDAGINIMGNFIFGLPGETEYSMKASVEFAMMQNFEYVNFYDAKSYPGSKWYEDIKPNVSDWRDFGQYVHPSQFRQKAFDTYFNRPEYLSMIRNKFGVKAEEHIKEMLKWKPECTR